MKLRNRWKRLYAKRKVAKAYQQVTEAYQIVLGRQPDAEGLSFHADALAYGSTSTTEMFRSLIESPEFDIRALSRPFVASHLQQQIGAAVQSARPNGQIAALLTDLVVSQLEREGAHWPLPPLSPTSSTISDNQTAALIRTLGMLAEPEADITKHGLKG